MGPNASTLTFSKEQVPSSQAFAWSFLPSAAEHVFVPTTPPLSHAHPSFQNRQHGVPPTFTFPPIKPLQTTSTTSSTEGSCVAYSAACSGLLNTSVWEKVLKLVHTVHTCTSCHHEARHTSAQAFIHVQRHSDSNCETHGHW
jgi:hypothetical protein